MVKFDFSVQTRGGQKIQSVVIAGRDQDDAERRLRQMYRDCDVLRCKIKHVDEKPWRSTSVEEILASISSDEQ